MSAYSATKVVLLSFTAIKVGLSYESGYLGTFVQVKDWHEDETIHRSDEAVSKETRMLMLPVLITA